MTRLFLTLLLALPPLSLPGCIAWEIRDEMRTVNRQLGAIDPVLDHTTKRLAMVNADIGETNRRLGEVQASLTATQSQLVEVHAALIRTDTNLVAVGDTLGQTNPRLTDLDGGLQRMQILHQVQTSLANVDQALGPLSKTMGSLSSTMSFFGMGGSGGETDLLAEETSPPPSGAPASTTGATTTTGATAAVGEGSGGSKPDLLIGTWLNAFPDAAHAIAILADGRFIRADRSPPLSSPSGKEPTTAAITRTGRWSREGRTLRFTFDPPSSSAGQSTTASSASADEFTAELIALTLRTLTVKIDGALRIYTRP